MKKNSTIQQAFLKKTIAAARVFVLPVILIASFNGLYARYRPIKSSGHGDKTRQAGAILKAGATNLLTAPTVSYTTPQSFYNGKAITPVTPASTGVAAPGYSATAVFGSGFSIPYRIAFDAAGNAYLSNTGTQSIIKIAAGSGTQTSYGTGIESPAGVAVDAAGQYIYVADLFGQAVYKITVSSNTTVKIGSGFDEPYGVAVDAAGNVYVAEGGATTLKEIPAAGGATIAVGSGFDGPTGVAVDATGNIYVADGGNNAVKKIAAGTGAITSLGSGYNNPDDVSVDASGNVFIADNGHNEIKELPAGATTPINLVSVSGPTSVTADGASNVYTVLQNSGVIDEIRPTGGYYIIPALPTGLIFNNTTGVISGTPTVVSAATNYTVTAYNATSSAQATISIKVAADSPDLSDLFLNTGIISPSFSAATTAYTETVVNGISSVTVDPTVASPGATVTVNGAAVESGSFSASIPLAVGSNTITTVVTSPDGTTKKTYTITVTRPSPLYPALTYASPKTYMVGSTIAALTPSNGGGALTAPAYGTSQTVKSISAPSDIVFDNAGNMYVAGNSGVQKFPIGGGAAIPVGGGATEPSSVAVDAAGNVFIADYSGSIIESPAANRSASVTMATGLSGPSGVALDSHGNIYFTEYGAGDVKKIPAGGGTPILIAAGISDAERIKLDAADNIYVVSELGTSIFKVPAGKDTLIKIGSGFNNPIGLAVDASGNVFVADNNNSQVKEIPVGSNTPVVLGSGYDHPEGVAVDPAGNIFVAVTSSATISEISPVGGSFISQFLPPGLTFNNTTGVIGGKPAAGSNATTYTVTSYNGSGSGTAILNIAVAPNVPVLSYSSPKIYPPAVAITPLSPTNTGGAAAVHAYSTTQVAVLGSGFHVPLGVAVDAAGNVYVADTENSLVKKIPVDGGAPVVIGTGFGQVYGVAIDASGNVYVADQTNKAIKEIKASDGSTVTLSSGFGLLYGVAVDAAGNVYAADEEGSGIMKIPPGGGTAVLVPKSKSQPIGVTVDATGNLYEVNNAANYVTEVPADGGDLITIGSGLAFPTGIAVDRAGNLYVADDGANVGEVRMYPADGGAIVPIGLEAGVRTYGVAVDDAGNVYVADQQQTTILKVTPVGGYYVSKSLPAGLIFNSDNGTISGTPTKATSAANYTITGYNIFGSGKAIVNIKIGTASNTNADLSAITVSKGTLSPVFAAATLSYTDMVTNGTASLTLMPTTADPTATVTVNGVAVISGHASGAITLVVGSNPVTTIVTAQDGTTKKTYTVNVIRPSTNAKLSALKISSGTLTPVFNTNTTSYTASVAGGVSSITLTPTAAVAGTTVTVNGTAVASGAASGAIALSVGSNVITTAVTAQDGVTKDTYTITVTRATASNNANLSGLAVNKGTLTPAFASTTINCTDMVTNGTATIGLTPTTQVTTSTITVNGVAVLSGHVSGAITLAVGSNIITTIVTAQDGTTKKTYTLTVIRPSTNAKLSLLKISSGTLTPAFNINTVSYTDAVTNAIASVTITPTVAVTGATVKVNGTAVASGVASGAIAMAVGSNTITTVVTAQDGVTTNTYTITITRAASGENIPDEGVGLGVQNFEPLRADDGVAVHQGLSPNGDGINDFLQIDNISQYPDNNLKIMNRNGQLVFEAKGYDNATKVFDGHSNKTGQMQLPGTYFYSLDYTVDGVVKHKTGFLVLKY